MSIKIELNTADLLDLTEALNSRISHSRECIVELEIAGRFDGKPDKLAGFQGRIDRLEALRARLINQWSGR